MSRTPTTDVFWSGFEAATSAALSFASVFIVARLIGPSEVGIGAAVVAVHVLLWVAVNALFADPLVQRAAVDDAAFSSALWASVAVGVVAAVVQVALAQPIAWLLGDHRLIPMSILLALPLPLVGAGGPVQGLLTRHRALARGWAPSPALPPRSREPARGHSSRSSSSSHRRARWHCWCAAPAVLAASSAGKTCATC